MPYSIALSFRANPDIYHQPRIILMGPASPAPGGWPDTHQAACVALAAALLLSSACALQAAPPALAAAGPDAALVRVVAAAAAAAEDGSSIDGTVASSSRPRFSVVLGPLGRGSRSPSVSHASVSASGVSGPELPFAAAQQQQQRPDVDQATGTFEWRFDQSSEMEDNILEAARQVGARIDSALDAISSGLDGPDVQVRLGACDEVACAML